MVVREIGAKMERVVGDEMERWACVKMEMRGVMDDEEMGAWEMGWAA